MNSKKFPQVHAFCMALFLIAFSTSTVAQDLVVIDSDYANKQQVLTSIPQNTPVLEIDNGTNPWKSIREKLTTSKTIGTIHLFVEANYNSLLIGGITYDIQAAQNEFELSMLEGLYQGTNLQLLIYNCNLASNDAGKRLLQEIGNRAYLNIAACTDCTSVFEPDFHFDFQTLDQPIDQPILQN